MPYSKSRSPGAGEKAVSAAALAVMAAVLAGVCLRQRDFDPAVLAASAAGAPAAAAQARGLLESWPAGLSPMGAPEAFGPDTLSDKIDGKADLYLSAGFVSLRAQRVGLAANPQAWMEVFVFDMGRPASAFSVLSSQRRPKAADAGIADYSYEADNELCIVHGRYYAEFVCSDRGEPAMRAAEALARAFVAATAVSEHANVSSEEALFPPEGQIAGSVALVPSDVFGSDKLENVFIARYRDGAGEVTLFAARRASAQEAARQADELRAFFVDDCGGRAAQAPAGPRGASMVELEGRFEAVFSSGEYLAGVHQAADRPSAERWLGVLARRLEGVRP
jgi:hypothetical protein